MILTLGAFIELLGYDLAHARKGFPGVYESVRKARRHRSATESPEIVTRVCNAVESAACFYWKPVLCLQRAAAITRLLRRHGVAAELVIGYRPSPFLSHAWVEVDGRIVNDSPVYQERLLVLDRV